MPWRWTGSPAASPRRALARLRRVVAVLVLPLLAAMVLFPATGGCQDAGSSEDEIYFYRDENGGMHFVKGVPSSNETNSIVLKKPGRSDRSQARLKATYIVFPGFIAVPREKVLGMIRKWSRVYGVDEKLVRAVVEVESAFRVEAVSHKGAQGLMQIMPETGRELGLKQPFDPDQNIKAGTKYLKQMLEKFRNVELALAAYNAGPHRVTQYKGIPPYDETRRYVRKVLAIYGPSVAAEVSGEDPADSGESRALASEVRREVTSLPLAPVPDKGIPPASFSGAAQPSETAVAPSSGAQRSPLLRKD